MNKSILAAIVIIGTIQAANAQDFNQRYQDETRDYNTYQQRDNTQQYQQHYYNPPMSRPTSIKRIGDKTFIYSGSGAIVCSHIGDATFCK